MEKENKIGERIKGLRQDRSEKISDVADAVGISQPALSNYERGQRIPDADVIGRLAKYFDCTSDYLIGISDFPSNKHIEAVEALLSKSVLSQFTGQYDSLSGEDIRLYLVELCTTLAASSKIKDKQLRKYGSGLFNQSIVILRLFFENICEIESKKAPGQIMTSELFADNKDKNNYYKVCIMDVIIGICGMVNDYITSLCEDGYQRKFVFTKPAEIMAETERAISKYLSVHEEDDYGDDDLEDDEE